MIHQEFFDDKVVKVNLLKINLEKKVYRNTIYHYKASIWKAKLDEP